MAQSWSWGTQAADTKILHVFNWKCHLFYSNFYIKNKGANELEVLQQVLEAKTPRKQWILIRYLSDHISTQRIIDYIPDILTLGCEAYIMKKWH